MIGHSADTNNSFRTTLYASLVRAGFILAQAAEVDVAVIAVHRKFSPFYQAMCGFRILGNAESYGGIAQPTHFLGRDFKRLDGRRLQRNAFFRLSRTKSSALVSPSMQHTSKRPREPEG